MTVEEGKSEANSDGSLHAWRVTVVAQRNDGYAYFVKKFRVTISPQSIPNISVCNCYLCAQGCFVIDDSMAKPCLDLTTNEWDVTIRDESGSGVDSDEPDAMSIDSCVRHWTNAGFEMEFIKRLSSDD